MPSRYPKDLASHVHSQLVSSKAPSPSVAVLVTLFEVLYFASLKSEEAERISCCIARELRNLSRINFLDEGEPHQIHGFTEASA